MVYKKKTEKMQSYGLIIKILHKQRGIIYCKEGKVCCKSGEIYRNNVKFMALKGKL